MKKRYFFLLFLLLNGSLLQAQTIRNLHFSLQSETVALPFTRYTPINPGAEIGATFYEVEKTNTLQSVNAYAGGFLSPQGGNCILSSAVSINSPSKSKKPSG